MNFDIVSREGEYIGGVLAPGVEISLEALTERGAKLPKIDLAPPRGIIGKNTVEAIRAGVIYGYAALVDGIVERLFAEVGEDAEVIATGGLAQYIVPHSKRIDAVDDLLTLTGLRLLHERNRCLATDRMPDPLPARRVAARPPDRAQPRAARARSPGSATGSCGCRPSATARAWRSRRWSRASASTTGTEDLRRAAAHPPGRASGRARRDPALRAGPRDHALAPPPAWRGRGADLIDLNMGCPVPKVCKTGAGAALLDDPDTAVAVARAAREGSGLPVTVKLRSGRRSRRARRRGAGAPAGGGGRRGGASPSTRARRRSTTRGGPTTTWPPSSWPSCRCRSSSPAACTTPRRSSRPASAPARRRSCSRAARWATRGCSSGCSGAARGEPDARARCWPSSTG